jgi:4-alpha-glucanotransferase
MTLPLIEFAPGQSHEDSLEKAASTWGIENEFYDIFGHKHTATPEIQERILVALGLPAESFASLEAERRRQFERTAGALIPPVSVLKESDQGLLLTVPGEQRTSVRVVVQLEEGGERSQTFEASQLQQLGAFVLPSKARAKSDGSAGAAAKAAKRWNAYRLPLPAGVPLGYHRVSIEFGGAAGTGPATQAQVIVAPEQAYLPERLATGGKTAGVAITLYGLRSNRNWGSGDFTDLTRVVDWAAQDVRVALIGLNPLCALHNRFPYNQSPYLPLSIYYLNLIYVDVERVPEYNDSDFAQRLRHGKFVDAEIRAVRDAEFVEYERVDHLKRIFLKVLYRQFERFASPQRKEAFEEYCRLEGDLLSKFALYCALNETLHKQDRNRWTWRDWPVDFHDPASSACQQFAREHWRLVRYYKYIQFVLEEQLNEVHLYAKKQLGVGLYHDLPLATDSAGSDLWAHRGFYVQGCRVGSPPDAFSPKGQDWAFPPPDRRAHKADGYCLFRQTIRKIVRFGGALRIDHVMRLFRLFWIPDGADASNGVYVKDEFEDLLRVLSLESVRNENIVVGEDLGTVTDEIRDGLARFRVLSYRLFYFEKRSDGSFKRSSEFPVAALVASTTHDLATIAGFWKSRDIEARREAGLADDASYQRQLADRKLEKQRMLDVLHGENLLPEDYGREASTIPELDGILHNAVMGFLAQTPSILLLINQEDLTKETEQQNLPGSTDQYPNWRRKMKWTVEELRILETARSYSEMFRNQLARTGRGRTERG